MNSMSRLYMRQSFADYVPPTPEQQAKYDEAARVAREARVERCRQFGSALDDSDPSALADVPSDTAVWVKDTWKPVRNLGWLLRHWKSVDVFNVVRRHDGRACHLFALMRDGDRIYSTPFASRSVLALFLARSVFMGAPLKWFGEVTEVKKGLE